MAVRIASSLACRPNCTVCEESTRTVAVERAEPGPELPVYHLTVLAEPLTRLVADDKGEPDTRSGGWAALTVPVKPSAVKAVAFELVTESVEASSVCSVMTPPWIVDGVDVPVIWSIFDSSACTLSVTLSWLPVAPEATKVSVVPSTVMVSPGAKLEVSESEPEVPDSAVAPVIGTAGEAWLFFAAPIAVPSVLKKLSPAAIAEAATSEVLASVEIDEVSAALKFAAVAAGVAPMAKLPVGNGVELDAVS